MVEDDCIDDDAAECILHDTTIHFIVTWFILPSVLDANSMCIIVGFTASPG